MKSDGMVCPACTVGRARVVTIQHRKAWIYRRRECEKCGARYSTCEMQSGKVVDQRPIQ
jgi:transcriptional regulator NrdR family protein